MDTTPDIGAETLVPGDGADTAESRSLSRRRMIRAAAITGAAAWTAPVIIDSLASPAAAVTCPTGTYKYVVLYSSTSGSTVLSDRPGGTDNTGGNSGTCDWTDPGSTCLHSNPSATYSTKAGVGLTTSSGNISHNISLPAAQGAITITLPATSCCNITSVKAHVHRFGAPTGNASGGDCPTDYCQQATTGGTYFRIATGNYGTKSVTVQPSTITSPYPCSNSQTVHWGSPNQDPGCQASGGYTNGQPFGYMLIELDYSGPV